MDSNHRLDPVSITPTVPRQTPNNDFGAVMARATGEVISRGAGVVGGFLGGAPVMSSAVSGMGSVVNAVRPVESATSVGPRGVVPIGGGVGMSSTPIPQSGARGENWELLQAQQALQETNQGFSLAYLKLQDDMQRESREFNAVSNIMKVRHDSAKSAINNIR